MDFQPEEIIEKIKKNKLAIPAIGVGIAVGVFLLYKNGVNGSSLLGTPSDDTANPNPDITTPGAPSGGGGGGDSGDSGAIGDLQNQIAEITSQQQGYASSFQNALNQLSDSLFGQLNQQAQQLQNQGQNYFSDGQSPNELDTYSSAISSKLSDLYNILSVAHVPDFAAVSPDLDVDKQVSQIQHIVSTSNQVVNSNILNALKNVGSFARQPPPIISTKIGNIPQRFLPTSSTNFFLGKRLPSSTDNFFLGRRLPSGISQGILDRWRSIVMPRNINPPVIQKTPAYYGFQGLNQGNFASVYNKVKANQINKPVIKKFGFKPFGF